MLHGKIRHAPDERRLSFGLRAAEAIAYAGERTGYRVSHRVAIHGQRIADMFTVPERIVIDLANKEGEVVDVGPDGWK